MKYLLVFSTFLLSAIAFGQSNSNVVDRYKRTTRNRSNGITFVTKNKLTLFRDSTYSYFHLSKDDECQLSGTEYGRWNIQADTLTLYMEFVYDGTNEKGYFNEGTAYLIRNNKLYPLNFKDDEDWELK